MNKKELNNTMKSILRYGIKMDTKDQDILRRKKGREAEYNLYKLM